MSEAATDNPKTPKRSKRKPAMEPVGWDEIVSQPGMGGYLSFLNGPVPLPHLQAEPDPVVDPPTEPVPPAAPAPAAVETIAESVEAPAPQMYPGVGPAPVRVRIRPCVTAQDGHSLGEEVLYQSLWKAAAVGEGNSRTIVIGWRGMSQLCRMTPKNCKINTQRLIRKLALEVLSPYNTPESIGTTYRVHSPESIVARRNAAGLRWVIRSKGVEFVNPASGAPLLSDPRV